MGDFRAGKRDLKRNQKCIVMFEVYGPKKKTVGREYDKDVRALLRKYKGKITYRACAQK